MNSAMFHDECTGDCNIIKMRREHLPEVMEIEIASFPDPWTEGMFSEELKEDGRRISLVLESGGLVAGYAIGWVVLDEFHLGNIAIASSKRGSGLGKLLLQETMCLARQAGCRMASLEVRPSNETAVGLYKAFGFRPIAVRRKYYRDEDALVMLADIESEKRC